MERRRILLADDQPHVHRLIAATLGHGQWELLHARDGEDALAVARAAQPAAVLLDVSMPKIDGFEVCRQLKSDPHTSHIAVVMLTAMRDEESRIKGDLAGADEYFVKPFSPLALVVRLQALLPSADAGPAPGSLLAAPAPPPPGPATPATPAVVATLTQHTFTNTPLTLTGSEAQQMLAYARDLNQSLAEARGLFDELQRSYLATVKALAAAVDARDPYTGGHVERVADFSVTIGRELGWEGPALAALEIGAALHDVGKIGVPDAILRKPTRLTEEEWVVMRLHPEIGARLLESIPFLQDTLGCVLRHHERYDGRGYPGRLVGAAIPPEARIVAVADSFDAMTTARPYRRALPYEHALREIQRGRGNQFDPTVVEAFEQVYDDLMSRLRVRAG